MTHDSISGTMLLVGGLMVLMPMLFAGALLGALWYRNRQQRSGEVEGESEQRAANGAQGVGNSAT